MKFTLALLFCLFAGGLALAQEDDEPKTIKFRKSPNLGKVLLDNTAYSLTVMDVYGNPRENRVLSYKLYVKGKKETKEFSGFSNSLTPEMVQYLNRQPKAVKIFFTEISVKDDNGHVQKMPDLIETWFPDCRKCP